VGCLTVPLEMICFAFCLEFGYNGSSLGTGLTADTREADARHPDSKGSWLVLRRRNRAEQKRTHSVLVQQDLREY